MQGTTGTNVGAASNSAQGVGSPAGTSSGDTNNGTSRSGTGSGK
jgi:hypothetical protein